MCPHCGRDAPLVYRGLVPTCAACGGLRAPLSTRSVNLAGKPSRLGGAVATAAGTLVLAVGLPLAVLVGALSWLLAALLAPGASHAAAALVVGGSIAAAVVVAGTLLVARGRALQRAGGAERRATVNDALIQLARERGRVSAIEAAEAIGISAAEADALLTDLAKTQSDRIALDLQDDGRLSYRAVDAGGESALRVAAETRPEPRSRVASSEAEGADSEAPLARRTREGS
ncbi:MAG TPA: hypothetical protein VEK07_14200 [Polyangiaceae bacterium]|nr:hypothetical protein [Polyangiaceae bacterium]